MTTTDKTVKYETKTVKTVRGMEARTRAKHESDGWEFVSQTEGTVRSELHFRRPKPNVPWKWIGAGGGLIAILIVVLGLTGALTPKVSAGDAVTPISSPTASETVTAEPTVATPEPTVTTTTPEPAPATSAPATSVATPAPVVTDITVDQLLDKLNSAKMGGIKTGDQFRITGELFQSDLWMNGVTGDYSVMFKAQDGAQDLQVFADETEASNWSDGTRLEAVLESQDLTINGETTGGWLRIVSAKVIP